MSLKYYNAYNSMRSDTPRDGYRRDTDAMLDMAFDNAPNVYYGDDKDCVEYEYEYGTNKFKPVPIVRIDEVLNYNTGIYSTDDFKVLVFKTDFFESNNFSYGSKFRWKGNTWLVISSGTLNGLVNSVEIRRCNNIARFYDDWGNEIYEPCILDMTLRFTRNNDAQPIITSNGEQKLWIQRNSKTVTIKGNQRFLFGPKESRVAYKTYASGAKDYINDVTDDDSAPSLTEIYMQFDQIDLQRDDVERGFADARLAFYSIQGKDITGEYKVGDIIPLTFSVFKGDDIVDLTPIFEIDNPGIATIEDYENGKCLHINNVGKFTLSVFLNENTNVKQEYVISVVNNPEVEYQIRLTPNKGYILQNNSQVYECNLYSNGALVDSAVQFEFKDNTINVPQNKYMVKIIDGQHFEVYNKGMFMQAPVKVMCKYGEYSQEFTFELRGVY